MKKHLLPLIVTAFFAISGCASTASEPSVSSTTKAELMAKGEATLKQAEQYADEGKALLKQAETAKTAEERNRLAKESTRKSQMASKLAKEAVKLFNQAGEF